MKQVIIWTISSIIAIGAWIEAIWIIGVQREYKFALGWLAVVVCFLLGVLSLYNAWAYLY